MPKPYMVVLAYRKFEPAVQSLQDIERLEN